MEEYVYDETNDYYNYLSSTSCQLTRPDLSLDNGGSGSYYDVIWHIFLTEKFGSEFIKRFWDRRESSSEQIKTTYDKILNTYGTSLSDEIEHYFIANAFTSSRAEQNRIYSEAANYPLSPYQAAFYNLEETVNRTVSSWASNFISININDMLSPNYIVSRSNESLKLNHVYKLNSGELHINPITFQVDTATFSSVVPRTNLEYEFILVTNTNYSGSSASYSITGCYR